VRANKKSPLKSDKTQAIRGHKRGVVGYSRKTALLEEAITQMNAGKYGRSSAALKELLALDPHNMEARRLFATLHLRLGSLIPARQAFDELIKEAFERQDYWLAESLLREYLAAGPRCVPYLEKLGALYQEKGDALEAVAEYGKAVDILIEDPDSDNPHHASQLYEKIRELAPASPVAFRLASFFDAETGELLARQSSDSGQSTVAPSRDMPEGNPGIPASPELMDGVMPWEIQDPQTTVPDVFTSAGLSDSSESLRTTTITDIPAHSGEMCSEALLPSETPLPEEAANGASEVGGDVPEETRTDEFGSALAGAQMDNLPEQGAPEDSLPSASLSEPVAERSETQPGPQPALSTADPVVSLQQDKLLAGAEPEASYDVSGPSTVSSPKELPNGPESPMSSPQAIENAGVALSSQIEEIAAPGFLTTPATAELIEAEDRQPSQHQPVETGSKEVMAEQSVGTCVPSSPESVSTHEMSEPWKQPGFSWESVFDSAWKFKSDRSADVSSSESARTEVEEAPPSASVAAPLQGEVLENQAVEIPEREESASLGDPTPSGPVIAPMPWDQVQESALSILPTRTDQPVAESTESTLDRSVGEPDSDWIPKVSADQSQPSIPPVGPAAETEAFSIAPAPQTSLSTEPEASADDVGQTSSQTEGGLAVVKPEQQPLAVSPLTIDKPGPVEAPIAVIPSPLFENRPVADDGVAPSGILSKSADSVLNTSNDRTTAVAQSVVLEAPITPSQFTSEPPSEISLHPPLPTQPPIEESPPEIAAPQHLAEEPTEVPTYARQPQAMEFVEAPTPIPEPAPEPGPEQEEWVKAGESIRFIEQPHPSSVAQVPPPISGPQEVSRSMSVAAAVDVLFESSRNVRATETREHVAEIKPSRKSSSALSRARIAIAGFVSSCFSTTRAVVTTCVGLVILSGVFIALGIGAIGLTWIIMEESPSPVYQSLTATPQHTLSDFKKNGYFLLLGIDASVGQDPMQAGYDRKLDINGGNSALTCFGGSGSRMIEGSNASANVMRGWVRSSDPVGEFKSHQETIKGWSNQHQLTLNRYSQWQKLPFEDWGYGQPGSPPCTTMVFAHQLYVADGFLQSADLGIDRLEADMEVWRIVLGQARTLTVKMLALQAINDDIAVASGLLVRSDFDGKYLRSLTKILRPLDQAELSMRWPMQSELVSAAKTYEMRLKAARAEEQPVYTMVASALPLPRQRRLNDYAEYYDASYKAAGEGKYGSLPKWKTYIHFPASGLMDYLNNPIENIVGLEPLPAWDLYNGLVIDTDAHLRLASLQAWLRRGPADGDLVTRIAKAGQSFYDPYTGLPMLMNMKKGVLYSVGHDGKDQDADPQSDVVVEIPVQMSAASVKPSAASSKTK